MSATVLSSSLLQDRFAAALLGLCEEAGVQSVRDRLMAPLLALLCRRLYRVMSQVSRVLARMQAGRSPIRRASGVSRNARVRVAQVALPDADVLRLRHGWAWMIRMAPRTAHYAPQIQLMLDEPEMQAALVASPSLRRAVRPLCRGLAFPVPPVLVERRDAAMQGGETVAQAAGPSRRDPTEAEEQVAAPTASAPMAWPESSRALSLQKRHILRAGRDSPRVAPAVFRLFTR